MSTGKIVIGGIAITVTGLAALLIGLPLMFSVVYYFIDKIISMFLIVVAIIILGIFVYVFLNK